MRDENALKQFSVLYVEDDELIRDNIGRFLRRRFSNAYIAKNGKEGLELFNEHNPDIVITDIEMPIMDGIRMINMIKEADRDKPVIITTGYNDDEHTDSRCMNLFKPIDMEKLLDALFQCLGIGS